MIVIDLCMFELPHQETWFQEWVHHVSGKPIVHEELCLAWDRICLQKIFVFLVAHYSKYQKDS